MKDAYIPFEDYIHDDGYVLLSSFSPFFDKNIFTAGDSNTSYTCFKANIKFDYVKKAQEFIHDMFSATFIDAKHVDGLYRTTTLSCESDKSSHKIRYTFIAVPIQQSANTKVIIVTATEQYQDDEPDLNYPDMDDDDEDSVFVQVAYLTGNDIKINKTLEVLLKKFKDKNKINEGLKQKASTLSIIVPSVSGTIKFESHKIDKVSLNIKEYYNDDFLDVHNEIIKSIETVPSGITLLHGIPGTGKTNYIRFLTTIFTKKCVYVPPNMTESITNPGFMNLMIRNKNIILIIEDAENVLATRTGGNNQAVSNILNLSDGLLGDILKMQIICTFNSSIDNIDPAILRPGRLIANYEFKELSIDKTEKLWKKAHTDLTTWDGKSKTLGEIFNNKPIISEDKSDKRQPFGFM